MTNLIIFHAFVAYLLGVLWIELGLDKKYIVLLIVLLVLSIKKSRLLLVILIWGLFIILGSWRCSDQFGQLEKVNQNQAEVSIDNLVVIERVKYSDKTKFVAISDGVPGKILVQSRNIEYGLRCNDKLIGNFKLEEPTNYDTFDYKKFLNIKGINYIVQLESYDVLQKYPGLNKCSLKEQGLINLKRTLPINHASLIAGLLWGENGDFSKEYSSYFQNTGTNHVIAVSGYNVSILVILGLRLSRFMPRKYVIFIIIFCLLLFNYLVGFDNLPAFRAMVMGLMVLISKTAGYKVHPINLISFAGLTILLMNSLGFMTISFQLSFMAFIGIVGLSDKLSRFVKIFKSIKNELATTLSAIIMTTPITFYNFGTFSIVAPLVNMLVLPIVPLLMLLGFVQLIVSSISIVVARFLSFLIVPFFDYFEYILSFFGRLEYSSISYDEHVSSMIFLFYFLVLIVLFEMNYRNHEREKISFS